jgi:putative hydrolase of HD superfamily
MSDGIQQIVDFTLELDKLKTVTRKIKLRGTDRYENSAEHTWQLTMFAGALAPFAAVGINLTRVTGMLLVHDVGEIDTGDTMAFVEGGWEERKAAELAAVRRIFGMLPERQRDHLVALWEEFEHGDSAEARYARAVDRAIPVLLNLANEGQSWRENGISYERVIRRIRDEIAAGCPALWDYLEPRLAAARDAGLFST